MRELTISKYNESYIKCTSEDLGLLQELSEFFTFKVPGASFMPSVRAKRWDGQIRLFSKATGKLYYGLLPYVEHFIENSGGTTNKQFLSNVVSKRIIQYMINDLPEAVGDSNIVRLLLIA